MWTRRAALASLLILNLAIACAMSGQSTPAGPAAVVAPQSKADAPVALPNKAGTLKFAVLGDFGTASKQQYQLAEQMDKLQQKFPYELVILVGDNLYGSERPQDFEQKFEIPYKPLLDRKVKFYASLGNHDDPNQSRYALFNMDAKRYYSFKGPKQSVKFLALESSYPEPEQIKWVEGELKGSNEDWKIPFFHHPLYSSGGRHGSDLRLRDTLEPLFVQHNVSVVFTGHDHFYERTKPQKGIVYFVAGSGGQLRSGDIDPKSPLTARGFDTDYAFMVCEIDGDQLYFNTISRSGQIVDSGIILRRQPPK
ncbi:MAG TPA: metallophosphoesterase [Vicinamibacterales bacterium]|nr:metallophosphoesterase [Vicinamibacterales bacterium]